MSLLDSLEVPVDAVKKINGVPVIECQGVPCAAFYYSYNHGAETVQFYHLSPLKKKAAVRWAEQLGSGWVIFPCPDRPRKFLVAYKGGMNMDLSAVKQMCEMTRDRFAIVKENGEPHKRNEYNLALRFMFSQRDAAYRTARRVGAYVYDHKTGEVVKG